MKNLLLITFDQMRGDWYEAGNKFIELPVLSELSRKGVIFSRCYTTSPQCVPARLSWLTGKMPSELGVTRNLNCSITDNIPTQFQSLKQNGIKTTLVGKTHWTSHHVEKDLRDEEFLIKNAGFDKVIEVAGPRALQRIRCKLTDEWEINGLLRTYKEDMEERYGEGRTSKAWMPKESCLPDRQYPDVWITDKAIEELKEQSEDKPWLLWVSYVGPHEPFDTPKRWSRRNLGGVVPGPIKSGEWIKKLNDTVELKKNHLKWFDKFNLKEAKKFREDYARNIMMLDEQVGKILKILEGRSDSDTTDIVITSDHGEMLGDYNMLYKSTFLEPAVRVPMIISKLHDKNNRIRVVDAPISSTEILKDAIANIKSDKEVLHEKCQAKYKDNRKVIIEYGAERCFIRGRKKLVVDRDSNILWSSIIRKRSIREDKVDPRDIERDNKQWTTLIKWSMQTNAKMNRNQGALNSFIDYN